jgi:hypothetical protein
VTTTGSCDDCGAPDARVALGDATLCDRCADRRVAEFTGWPELGAPPPPIHLLGPDGVEHELRYRLWRAPTGICAELEEAGVAPGEGFHYAVLGDHDADVAELLALVRSTAEHEVGRQYLERSDLDGTWQVADTDVAGRFVWNDEGHGDPHRVVVDGRTLSWEQFGRAFAPFEGCQFRVEIGDRFDDRRPDAEILAFPTRREDVGQPALGPDASAAVDVEQLRRALAEFERSLRDAGASASSVRTTIDRAAAFVDYLAGETPAPRASASLPDADVDRARRWAQQRNDRLPERAIGQIRYEVDIAGQAVTMYECRPPWRPEYGPEWTRFPIVRFRYTKTRREWTTYWRDRNSKFHRYDPIPPSLDLQDLIDAVETDRSGIFWG